ncbi:TniQ family protein [Niveibacterium sp. 24ML]|uniref:TniQ family protein n=1 Tax=Niveibacterium sp. 24ML TaxID=2985512 RepID=UPI003B63E945
MRSTGLDHPNARLGPRSSSGRKAALDLLWPIHLKPQPDELMTSWFVRLAHAHDLKLHTLGLLLYGAEVQLWSRDLDALAPDWLLAGLSAHTGLSDVAVRATTLKPYAGRLFPVTHNGPIAPWILPLRMAKERRQGHGVQFCPKCLSEDSVPYFRRRWRLALCTYCTRHECLLLDRCQECGSPVEYHRGDVGIETGNAFKGMTTCCSCGADLRQALVRPPSFYAPDASELSSSVVLRLEGRGARCRPRSAGYFSVLHQLCRLMMSRYRNVRLGDFAAERLGVHGSPKLAPVRLFELLDVADRHHLLQLAFWVMSDLRTRLRDARLDGAITYSGLLRDFSEAPRWYRNAVVGLRRTWVA